jgi:hypothetical protein
LWPFGYGLSYTTFTLGWGTLADGDNAPRDAADSTVASIPPAPVIIDIDDPSFETKFAAVRWTVSITNTGTTAAKETVIAYWMPPADAVAAGAPNQLVFDFKR